MTQWPDDSMTQWLGSSLASRHSSLFLRPFDPELFQAILERPEGHAQQLGSFGDVPVGTLQRFDDLGLLVLLPRALRDDGIRPSPGSGATGVRLRTGGHDGLRAAVEDFRWKVGQLHPFTLTQQNGALDRHIELADVPRPVISLESFQGLRRDAPGFPARCQRRLAREVQSQLFDVLPPFPQGRANKRDDVQAAVEVLADFAPSPQ